MYVCQTITVESLDFKFIFAHPLYLQIRVRFAREGHRVKVKITGVKKVRKYLFAQCKTSIGHNSASIIHRAMRFACSMGFLYMADQLE